MPIEFVCPACQTTLRVSEQHAGKKAKCPHCQSVMQVPMQSAPATPPMAPPMAPPTPPPVNPYGNSEPLPPLTDPSANNPYVNGGSPNPPGSNPYLSSPANPYQSTGTAPPQQRYQKAHRGALILILGIMSIMCNFFLLPGILAWVLGRGDLKQMDAGAMDPSGRGVTTAGMVIGIIMTCLYGLSVCFYIFAIVALVIGGNM